MIYVNCPQISHEKESNMMTFYQIYENKIDLLIVDPAYHKIEHISVCSDDTSNDYSLVQDMSFFLSWK